MALCADASFVNEEEDDAMLSPCALAASAHPIPSALPFPPLSAPPPPPPPVASSESVKMQLIDSLQGELRVLQQQLAALQQQPVNPAGQREIDRLTVVVADVRREAEEHRAALAMAEDELTRLRTEVKEIAMQLGESKRARLALMSDAEGSLPVLVGNVIKRQKRL